MVRLLRGASVAASAMPEVVVGSVAGVAGRVWFGAARLASGHRWAPGWATGPVRQRFMLSRHLRRAVPNASADEIDRLVARGFSSYVRYWIDLLRLPRFTRQRLNRVVRIEGLEHFDRALAQGKGVVIALPHLGGWEFGAAWLTAHRDIDLVAVAEKLSNEHLYEWFVEQRAGLGISVVPLGPEAGIAVARAVAGGSIVALPCDRDLTGTGVEVEFLGEHTTLPSGPVLLALRSGAPLLVAAVFDRSRGRRIVRVRPPWPVERTGAGLRADVAHHMQRLADELGVLIRMEPSQWHLLQPNWPSDRLALDGLARGEPQGAR